MIDNLFRDQVAIHRWAAAQEREMLKLLRGLVKDLQQEILSIDPTAPMRSAYRQQRLAKLLESATRMIESRYGEMASGMETGLRDLFRDAVRRAERALATVVQIETMRLSADVVRALVGDLLIEGAHTATWWHRQADSLMEAFADQVRMGMLRAESIQEIMQRVAFARHGRAAKQLELLVRSSTQVVANAARMQVYQGNTDVVEGVEWVATFDARTTDICIALAGLRWSLPDMEPVDHRKQYPGPTAHWGCRSTQTAVVVGQARQRIPTYEEWLRTQPTAYQMDVLGPSRYRLWVDGKLSLRDLTDFSGRPRPLEELA
jgi:SPP1 gp7 family putative phage head morphogenesis protein